MVKLFLIVCFSFLLFCLLTNDASPDQLLFSDDFSDGKMTDWEIVDFEELDPGRGPSDWVEADDVLHQNTDTEGVGGALAGRVEGAPDDDPRVGTHAIAGDKEWRNYTFSVDLLFRDDDFAGLLFRYQDEDNYYRFQLEEDDEEYHISRMKGGSLTFLVTNEPLPEPFSQQEWVTISVDARGNDLKFFYKGQLIETIKDPDLGRGSIGLMTSSSPVDFDNVKVEGDPAAVSASGKLAASWGYLKSLGK
jgi:hypothetical protein